MRIQPIAALLIGGLIVASSTSAFANRHKKSNKTTAATVTGLSALHTLTRTGNRLCMSDHYHFGDGESRKSKAQALKAAKRDWVSFVSAEYGSAWARYSLAGSKGGKCTKKNGLYVCSISARPCKR